MTHDVKELQRRLREAEAQIEALRNGQVDAVVGEAGVSMLRALEYEEKYRQLFSHMKETEKKLRDSRAAALNITEDAVRARRQAEKAAIALRESEETLRMAMNAGRVFTFEWDPETDTVYRSQNCAPILGLPAETCAKTTGQEHFRRVHEEDREMFEHLVRHLTPETCEYEKEYRYVRDDGREIWLEESGRAEFDENGRFVRLYGIAADVTDRVMGQRRAQEEAAAEAAVQTVNAMGEGVALYNIDGTILAVNPAIETLTGLSRDDIVGRNMRDLARTLLEGKDWDMAERALDDTARGMQPELRTVTIRRPGCVPVSVNPAMAFIEPGGGGQPETAVLTLKDVTESHELNELLNRIFDTTHMQIAYLDTDFNFVRVNRAYADACRRDPDFFPGRNHFDLYPHQENEAIFRRVRDTGEPFTIYEKPFEFPDQPERGITWWDWSLHPVTDDNGVLMGLLFCLLDATERVQLRKQFIDTEHRYRELVENANSIIMRVTPDQRILFFNEFAQTFFGYAVDEVLGRSVVGTIVPEIDSEGRDLRELVDAIAEQPELYGDNENENMRKDGSRVWVHWANRAIRNEQGEIAELLCVGQDITERKKLETEAETYRRRLQALADRLIETESNERRNLAAYIHDTVIQTLSLSNIRLNGVCRELADREAAEQIERLNGVRRLIDDGIAECRSMMDQLAPSLLYEFGLLPALEHLAEKHRQLDDTTIVLEDAGAPPIGDDTVKTLLFQSARELLMNALKYAGPCEIRIRVYAGNDMLCVEVRDNGRGFDPATLDRAVTKDEGGFGLFNVRERMESFGGRLVIDTAPGRGAVMTLCLPIGVCGA